MDSASGRRVRLLRFLQLAAQVSLQDREQLKWDELAQEAKRFGAGVTTAEFNELRTMTVGEVFGTDRRVR
jgi:hypothetical protein